MVVKKVACQFCSEKIAEDAIECEYCGGFPSKGSNSNNVNVVEGNTSGLGKNSTIPEGVKRFNWGAFFFPLVWGIFNKSYTTLFLCLAAFFISFLPFVKFIPLFLGIVCGISGNEWAWRGKKWQSVEHFHKVQRSWALWSLVATAVLIAAITALIVLVK